MKESITVVSPYSIDNPVQFNEKQLLVKTTRNWLNGKKEVVREIFQLVSVTIGVGSLLLTSIYLFLIQLAKHGW